MKNLGNIHIIVGMTGTGKTTHVKSLIKSLDINKVLIYDTNREYLLENNLPDFIDFLQMLINARNKVVIIEDATIFLKKRGYTAEIEKSMVQRRHTSNYIFLLFHSINKIPSYIIELANIITIFKTGDKIDNVIKLDNEIILNTFIEVNQHPDKYFYKTIILKD